MLTVDVPLNTMLADLDETLRGRCCRRELERHGFEGVDIAFDAPVAEWSGQLSKPDGQHLPLRPARGGDAAHERVVADAATDGRTFEGRPPMVMECSYAVTAWTQAVEDEHRLLSQVLAILFAYPELPQDRAQRAPRQRLPARGRSRRASGRARARSRTSGARSAASTRCRSTTSCGSRCDSGATLERGPEVRTQTVRTRLDATARRARSLEMHRSVGTVSDKKGEPLADVWVTLPDVGTLDRRATPTAASASTACRPAGTGCWRARPTAARPTRSSKCPAPASTW